MFDRLSIRGRLMASVVMSIGFLTLLAGVSIYGQQRGAGALADVRTKGVQPLVVVQEIDGKLREVRFNMAGAVLDVISANGARNHLKETRDRLPLAWQEFKAGFDTAGAGAEERKLVEDIGKELAGLPALFDSIDAAYQKDDKAAITALLQEKWPRVHKSLVKPLAQLIPARAAAVQDTFESSTALGNKMNMLTIGACAACIVILLLLVVPLVTSLSRAIGGLKATLASVADGDLTARPDTRRGDELGDMARSLEATIKTLSDIISGVQNAADTLAGTTDQLSTNIQEMQQRGRARAEAMDRAGNAIEAMSGAANNIADGSTQVASASGETRTVAISGNQRMEASIVATQRVEEAVGNSAAVIAELSSSTDRINEVTQVIREIADQTNLLALNAAIEAARAGEQGRGFAVVADEVRKLAERTSSSTADIAETVGAIRLKTAQAVEAMGKVHDEVENGVRFGKETQETLTEIVAAAERVTGLAENIAEATRDQLAASEHTAQDMNQVTSMNEDNKASMNQAAEVTQRLAGMAHELQHLIRRFRV